MRAEAKPKDSTPEMAREIGIELSTEEQYRELQKVGEFDLKTSSWIWTPLDSRSRGSARFCDQRYGRAFVYHNGVWSCYASSGCRGLLRV
jgi:hypothetical protein